MTLTEMKRVLAAGDIQLTKSLGQNFLHDGNQLRRIVDAAALTTVDKVLEIGPGLGPLTELLIDGAGEVFAIEKDLRLVGFLRERFGLIDQTDKSPALTPALSPEEREKNASFSTTLPNLSNRSSGEPPLPGERAGERADTYFTSKILSPKLFLLHDDALKYLQRERRDWSGWKLVANLPYSVASPILVELAQSVVPPQRLVATLQLEVARRLMATADDDDYGVLTLLVQLRYEPVDWFKIPSGCFYPEPEVDSACVVLKRRATPLLTGSGPAAFEKIVKRGFSQRRKMMLKLLKQDWPAEKLAAAFEQLSLSPQVRAEKLNLDQFVALTEILLS